ncbi:MAG: hypothetical protein A2268_02255 [Candidatus Raymondbacteria bacterium RifOxyA12_full_50_37]|uniref:Type 4 fimbrial biogenesis protein PilX N-terminal domain-containing protein n=1 Tax=Candidatus Raymondbacteria bacterium RIFOXYD12_FULL_49_13 TaxID=1817890 RepID=A0A1F7F5D1_UNCRA|nr:MAG: hypothetical protein A2350_07780 [Candidatus Raymondbacteria bacterium RifOxyB12_full_50_8]OGJ91277.1 MAG: hypothetical protein A2268_02255 [Candidatus Raymondbacteria bacterium RifOxyA12_full_50_37]OGJ92247.1 MAG: hypothetical protein A2248_11085 [Candidatus Raymondbacteria bacterium RIFOXYA2_FULL_49_16]OGJ98573.1 MAG: hypothetical protein A2453_06885 [Candidatus Raymondbacteria bacterium RIFOXYC2_FULL_50_21]OGK01874.1 MAG: hypothetical protein A2519_04780 [Candidatus Raymondbacteria b
MFCIRKNRSPFSRDLKTTDSGPRHVGRTPALANQDGYAAYLVLSLLVIIAFLLNAIILGYGRHRKSVETYRKKIQTGFIVTAAEEYVQYLMNTPDGLDYLLSTPEIRKELDSESGFSVSVTRKGCFLECGMEARYGTQTRKINRVIGQRHTDLNNSALFVFGGMSGLILGGNATIEGNVHLPSGSVNTSSQGYFTYRGGVPMQGKVVQDSRAHDFFIDKRLALLEVRNAQRCLARVKAGVQTSGHVPASVFSQANTLYEHGGDVNLDNSMDLDLNGGTLVVSGNVRLNGNSAIRDGTLYANGEVELKDRSCLTSMIVCVKNGMRAYNESSLKGQFITPAGISVNNYTKGLNFTLLLADSSLWPNAGSARSSITIMDRAEVHGVVVYSAESEQRDIRFTLGEGAMVDGFVYCAGSAEIRGSVLGQAWTSSFACMYNRTVHGGIMMDGKILSSKQDWQTFMPPLFGVEKELAFYEK